MKILTNFPIVNARNVFSELSTLRIRPLRKAWKRPMSISDYLKGGLDTEQWEDYRRFCPRTEIMVFRRPDKKRFTGFRTVKENWATTFALLPGDYLLVAGEWKHGVEAISLSPPSGVIEPKDKGSMARCAKREYEDETGITLKEVIPLSGSKGISINSRNSSQVYFPFLGIVKTPIRPKKTKLDKDEQIQIVQIHLNDWLTLIEKGKVIDDCAITTTYLALQRLGRMKID